MDVPSPWEFVLLALAAWRVWWLIGEDDLTEPLRARVPWQKARDWIECPYCSGAWVAGAVWVSWTLWPRFSVWFATVWAVAAVVVFVTIAIHRLTD